MRRDKFLRSSGTPQQGVGTPVLIAARQISATFFCAGGVGRLVKVEVEAVEEEIVVVVKVVQEENEEKQKQPAGRFSARVFSLFFFHTSGMGSSFSVVFTMFFLFHVLFWCLTCCHLQW